MSLGAIRFRLRAALLLALVTLAQLTSCTTTALPAHPRAARELAATERARFEAPKVELVSLAPLEEHFDVDVQRGKLAIDGQELRFYCYLPKRWKSPRPFLSVLPILGGGEEINEMVCVRLARRGIAAGTLERRWKIFKSHEQVAELETKFISAVRQQRAFLDWIATQPRIDAQHLGVFGLSVGGMIATLVAAVDARVSCAVIALAGGNLGTLVVRADEIQTQRWVKERLQADGITPRELEERIARQVSVDPVRYAQYVDPRAVLFIAARFDAVVPHENIEALWDALGRPQRIRTPLGHYTSILVLDSIVAAADRFARERFGLAREHPLGWRDDGD